MKIEKVPEWMEWFEEIDVKSKALIEARLFRVEVYDHFGDAKSLWGFSR